MLRQTNLAYFKEMAKLLSAEDFARLLNKYAPEEYVNRYCKDPCPHGDAPENDDCVECAAEWLCREREQ